MKTTEKIFSYIEEYHMLRPGERVVAGISGGADSVCLLLVLLEWKARYGLELIVAHVNHGIRKEARMDAQFVEKLCKGNDLDFYLKEIQAEQLAGQWKCSEEEAGRISRYAFFEEVLEKTGADRIAVAHNMNDRCETMLFHLFRGTGIQGLSGILPVRDRIIRPLLCVEREEIEEYLKERGQDFCRDVTNEQDDYTRNRIRHHILPYAQREVSAGCVRHMGQTAELLEETEEYLRCQTEKMAADCVTEFPEKKSFHISCERFGACPGILQKRLLFSLLKKLSPGAKDITRIHVEELLELCLRSGNRRIQFPFGITGSRIYEEVVLESGSEDNKQDGSGLLYQEDAFVGRLLDSREWKAMAVNEESSLVFPQNQYTKWFDYDKMNKSPIIRKRQTGDYLMIRDREGVLHHKSLQDYMVGARIPAQMRDRIPVLAIDSHVIWLVGYRISEFFKVNENTKQVLQVQLIRDCEEHNTEEKMAEHVRVLLSEKEVDDRIQAIGDRISKDYAGKQVHLVCVLKGGSFFLCELAKRITVPVSLDFMSVSSYGGDTKSSGVVKIVKDLDDSIKDKDVLVVEDIVDSGRTLSYLLEMLQDRGPRSLKLCTLLDKPERRVVDVNVDYTGFQIPDEFVVGYGLDYDQRYRNLPYIGVVEFD